MIRIEAPAKVNLSLRVLAREASGYHSIETVFCAVSLFDEVVIERAGAGTTLHLDGAQPTERPEENLVVRAARCFAARGGACDGFRIGLTKRIPAAAGLGGGSSDAAAALLALDALHPGAVAPAALLDCAAELGSDVPFFLCGSPLALGWGRGQRLLPLPPLPPRHILIANPGAPIPTAAAFRRLAELRGGRGASGAAIIAPDELASWDGIARAATNDFEEVAIEMVPTVGAALRELRQAGAIVAMLAGSGASVYGIFQDQAARDAAEHPLTALGFATWRAATLEEMPLPYPGRRRSAGPAPVDPSSGHG